ncbi:MAG TPA: glycerophosphodiester phosphodiesterase family protein [Actinomycetota bacterium]|nr:glycerophosphodiester phosphodiesterase family protein [Actinomycetota bacterium]
MANLDRQIWPAVVAHRGASALYPENTLQAFEGAIKAGADLVELDVRLTSDGVPVILHDLDVSITTDGTGRVHELTLADIKRLDASKGRDDRTEVPTLQEALELLSGRAGVNIEIKNLPEEPAFDSPKEAAVEKTLDALQEIGFSGPVVVCSFNWLSIERVRELEPSVPTGFLTIAAIDPWASLTYVKARGHSLTLPHVAALESAGEEFVHAAHADGIRIGTWTVDEAGMIERLFEMGVDALATNDPATAVPIRDRVRSGTRD